MEKNHKNRYSKSLYFMGALLITFGISEIGLSQSELIAAETFETPVIE